MAYSGETAVRENVTTTLDKAISILASLEGRFHGLMNESVAEKNGNRPPLTGALDMAEQVYSLAERVSEQFNRLEGKLGGPV